MLFSLCFCREKDHGIYFHHKNIPSGRENSNSPCKKSWKLFRTMNNSNATNNGSSQVKISFFRSNKKKSHFCLPIHHFAVPASSAVDNGHKLILFYAKLRRPTFSIMNNCGIGLQWCHHRRSTLPSRNWDSKKVLHWKKKSQKALHAHHFQVRPLA